MPDAGRRDEEVSHGDADDAVHTSFQDVVATGSDVETRVAARPDALRRRLGLPAKGSTPSTSLSVPQERRSSRVGCPPRPDAAEEAFPRRQPRPPGITLIEPAALDRAIGTGFRGDPDEKPEATSSEEETRLTWLRRYAQAPGGLFRRHLVADETVLRRLAALKVEAPNAARAIAVVERAALLSHHARSPLRVPPLLIVGEPGTGKSRVARRVAEALGTKLSVIDGGSVTDRGPIVGYEVGYRGSGPGIVARALLDGETAAPAILVDEVDKVSSYRDAVRPLDTLLPLLEPSTARRFMDTYVSLPMRADGVCWIMTANSVAGLPSPLLDRVVVVEMPRLGRNETRTAIQRLFAELLHQHGLDEVELSDAALLRLERQGLRQVRRILSAALGPALAAGRSAPDATEIAEAAALLDPPRRRAAPKPKQARRPPVGFIRFPSSGAATGRG